MLFRSPDGWTRPGRTARIRVFAKPGQRTALRRTLTLTLLAPGDVPSRHVVLRSNDGVWPLDVTANSVQQTVSVCVPRTGPADVTLQASGASPIDGNPSTIETFGQPRAAGVLVGQVTLAESIGPNCSPSR